MVVRESFGYTNYEVAIPVNLNLQGKVHCFRKKIDSFAERVLWVVYYTNELKY
jgi:hypothetical protein